MDKYIMNDEPFLEHWSLFGGERKNHKYVKRIKEGNKYKYFYSWKEYLKYIGDNKEKYMMKAVNKAADKVMPIYKKIADENEFISNDHNYDQKIAQVKKSKEWQDIVKRKDPEYVHYDKKNKKYVYDVDSYYTKKKHPVLDVLDDFTWGRKATINKINTKTLAGTAYDYARSYVVMAGIGAQFLLQKFKFSQGTYHKQKKALYEEIKTSSQDADNYAKIGKAYIKAAKNADKIMVTGSDTYSSKAQSKQIADDAKRISGKIRRGEALNKDDMATISKDYNTARQIAPKAASEYYAQYKQYANDAEKVKKQYDAYAKKVENGEMSYQDIEYMKEDYRRLQAKALQAKREYEQKSK